MISNALIAKSVAGIATLGGASGGIYACRKQISDFFTSFKKLETPANSYLIVKVSEVVEANKNTISTGENKNYYCQIKDEAVKIDCEISEVVFGDKKSIDLSSLNSPTATSKEKNKLLENTTDKYFKLKLNQVDLDKFDFSSEKTIDLVTNATWSSTKYATLNPQFKVNNGKATLKNELLLVGVVVKNTDASSGTDGTFANYKCTIDSLIPTPTQCSFYKFTPDVVNTTEWNAVDFSKLTPTPVSQISDIPVDKLSVIQLTTPAGTDLNSVKDDSTVINFKPYSSTSPATVETGQKTYSFTLKARLFGNPADAGKGIFILR